MNNYITEVPDHHDRIVWRGRYYHLENMKPTPTPVGEGLPDDRQEVLVWRSQGDLYPVRARFVCLDHPDHPAYAFEYSKGYLSHVTHWMALPDDPEPA